MGILIVLVVGLSFVKKPDTPIVNDAVGVTNNTTFSVTDTGIPSINDAFTATPGTFKDVSSVTVPFEETTAHIAPAVATNFSTSEVSNLDAVQKAYGVTFSKDELSRLEQNKFVVKNLLDTNLAPVYVMGDNDREFVSLYSQITGSTDYMTRTPANAVFVTSDVLMNLFSILSVDLMKETENTYLYDQVSDMSRTLYTDAVARVAQAKTDSEKNEWVKVRNYFAIPYALLSTAQKMITAEQYWNSDKKLSLEETLAQNHTADATADAHEKAVTFVKNLKLDTDSETRVLADLARVYEASENDYPDLFKEEYQQFAERAGLKLEVPFSLFTVRGTYTSSSLRRQYFRAVQWYQQIAFFTGSPELGRYAVDMGVLMQQHPELLKQYQSMTSLLGALVGKSDDLDVGDYVSAVKSLGTDVENTQKLNAFLDTQKPQAQIKSMPALYPSVGKVTVAEVTNATRGMRFFSQKFIPDSYWTGRLTQGDEAPAVNGMKLPDMASSLEVMSILGSNYAHTQLPQLPFYEKAGKAVEIRLAELKKESDGWGDAYWKENQVTGILWSISGMFNWLQSNKVQLPQFMQSPLWEAKTLLTGSAFWTELRHTNILYAKQSFAEKGGGGDGECDTRKIPPATVGYVEPQPLAYDRLYYTARLLNEEYTARGITLANLTKLQSYIKLLDIVREYTKLELQNTQFSEKTISKKVPFENNPNCVTQFIDPAESVVRGSDGSVMNADGKMVAGLSRAEELRTGMVMRMREILPTPVEGPILPIKDKRTAVVADVHTSPSAILEEGTGVPRVLFVMVKDVNGSRLTVGFTYSHYETFSQKRLTDEEWQTNFYTDLGGENQITYKPKAEWPEIPVWYQSLLGKK
ncbi:MAG: hypothetical protein RLZZ347_429 [Candidatus Parcubacteria bacterium]